MITEDDVLAALEKLSIKIVATATLEEVAAMVTYIAGPLAINNHWAALRV